MSDPLIERLVRRSTTPGAIDAEALMRAWPDPERWERREDASDARDHDDRDADPLGGIYRDDEPQEWRA